MSPPPSRPPWRKAAFAAVVTVAALVVANAVVGGLERAEVVDTRTADDWVRMPGTDGLLHSNGTELELRAPMIATQRMALEKGDGWRAFVVGGSFAMGTPETERRPDGTWVENGGISHELRRTLRADDRRVEVINAASGGMDSNGVAMVARAVLPHEADLLVVASCNNEGALPPSLAARTLEGFAGYRLLRKAVRPDVPPAERSYYTPQSDAIDRVRDAFRANLEGIVSTAEAQGVPVLLATLPVNLRYAGEDAAVHSLRGVTEEAEGDEAAAAAAERCAAEGKALLDARQHGAAIAHLEGCAPTPDSLRWTGLALLAEGEVASARAFLEQSLEAQPMNRCRPSFQTVIREVAAAHEHVHLVDLQAGFEALSPGGMPGADFFVDYCHMTPAGYRVAGRLVRERIEELGLGP